MAYNSNCSDLAGIQPATIIEGGPITFTCSYTFTEGEDEVHLVRIQTVDIDKLYEYVAQDVARYPNGQVFLEWGGDRGTPSISSVTDAASYMVDIQSFDSNIDRDYYKCKVYHASGIAEDDVIPGENRRLCLLSDKICIITLFNRVSMT